MIVQLGCKMAVKGALALALVALTSQAMAKEYIVKFKSADEAATAGVSKSFEGEIVTDVHTPGALVKLDLGKSSLESEARTLANLMQRDDVEYVVESFKLKSLGQPNDPRYSEQWSMAKIRASEAFERGVGSRQTVVAIIDTGIDYKHEDLSANAWTNPNEVAGNGLDDDGNGYIDDVYGWDFKDDDSDPTDITSKENPGHGTHCAGIIGAIGDNGTGISGMAQQVSLMALRFIGPDGSGDLMGAIKAIDYAIAAKVDVISASWGAKVETAQAQPLIEAVGRASNAGIVFVAAAANDGANNDTTSMYPANSEFPNVIAVAASDNDDAKPSWSNYGKGKVHLASPGLNILSSLPNGQYGNLSGTSMATPLVAGLVALLKSQSLDAGKTLTGIELRSLLQVTGAQVAIETACMCRIDAKAASDALATGKLVVVPAAATFALNATAQLAGIGGSGNYTFTSANPAVLEVAANGSATAKAEGETTVTIKDSKGQSATSLTLRVANGSQDGGSKDCPLGDPTLCAIICQIQPTLPWCN